MVVSRNSLLYFLADSLFAYSQDFRIIHRTNPILFALNGTRYSVHISSIHDSGNARDNEDEERIQISRVTIAEQRNRSSAGAIPLFLGFFPDGKVFSAWEPDHVFAQNPIQGGGSVYARLSHYLIASDHGAALRVSRSTNLGRDVVTLSLRSEALGFYVENCAILHRVTEQVAAQRIMVATANAVEPEQPSGLAQEPVDLGHERVIVTVTRKTYARNTQFREAVMRAYEGRCCVCQKQLGLVQAAHIVPHSHPESLDHITNGLALCIEHHRLYDDALLLPASAGRLHLNPDRVEHLQNIGQDSGIDAIRALAATHYRVPDHVPSRPRDDYLDRGVRIRLGTDA